MPTQCDQCHATFDENGIWPWGKDQNICFACWEANTAATWWDAVATLEGSEAT